MTRKYRAPLLAATMALILGNSASAAERATGLYFEATVGMASADLGSKSELDQSFTGPIVVSNIFAGWTVSSDWASTAPRHLREMALLILRRFPGLAGFRSKRMMTQCRSSQAFPRFNVCWYRTRMPAMMGSRL
jgi:hypothetical protein